MTSLAVVRFAANDLARLASFWAGLLPAGTTPFAIGFFPADEPKTGLNRAHLDLTSESLEDQRRTVARALELGATHLDVGQRPEDEHVVLADPEGNELCVIEPGNAFLAGCGRVGAVTCDGTPEVGYFWSAALGWPLVWDRDGETAIQSPLGGPKIAWSGTAPSPRAGLDRVRFDLSPGGDQAASVERLLSLGATRVGGDASGAVVLADPDGRVFHVLPA